jgi:hypothetical protein
MEISSLPLQERRRCIIETLIAGRESYSLPFSQWYKHMKKTKTRIQSDLWVVLDFNKSCTMFGEIENENRVFGEHCRS